MKKISDNLQLSVIISEPEETFVGFIHIGKLRYQTIKAKDFICPLCQGNKTFVVFHQGKKYLSCLNDECIHINSYDPDKHQNSNRDYARKAYQNRFGY